MIMDKKQFEKFSELLKGKEGCNFTEKVKDDPNSVAWKCYHDFRFTKKILEKHFKNIDAEEFIKYC